MWKIKKLKHFIKVLIWKWCTSLV